MIQNSVEIFFQSSCGSTFRPDPTSPHRRVVRSIVDLIGGVDGFYQIRFRQVLMRSMLSYQVGLTVKVYGKFTRTFMNVATTKSFYPYLRLVSIMIK